MWVLVPGRFTAGTPSFFDVLGGRRIYGRYVPPAPDNIREHVLEREGRWMFCFTKVQRLKARQLQAGHFGGPTALLHY